MQMCLKRNVSKRLQIGVSFSHLCPKAFLMLSEYPKCFPDTSWLSSGELRSHQGKWSVITFVYSLSKELLCTLMWDVSQLLTPTKKTTHPEPGKCLCALHPAAGSWGVYGFWSGDSALAVFC